MVLIPWPWYENSSAAAGAPSRGGWNAWISEAEVSAAPLTSRKTARHFGAEHFGEAAQSLLCRQGQLSLPCATLGCCRDSGEGQPVLPLAVFVTEGGDSLLCPGRCLMAAA